MRGHDGKMQNDKVILYASYQTGETLPGYVQFALQHLSETPFRVVLLTNRRELSPETLKFLEEREIFLYQTENHGFDFGMWRRFLKELASGQSKFVTLSRISRLVLMNDSIVYYRNRFQEFLDRAEKSDADAIALTKSEEYRPHLQSFFLYLKQEALGAFYMHLLETPEQENYYDVVHRLEIGMANAFDDAEIKIGAIFGTGDISVLSYKSLVQEGAGFVKRKLLQHRFNLKEKMFFVRHEATDVLNANYNEIIKEAGMDPDFKEEWLPKPVESNLHQAADALWEKPLEKIGTPLYETFLKAKNKLLKK